MPPKKPRPGVTLPTKGNKRLQDEPEMQELKRMIRDGELDPERVRDHLDNERDSEHGTNDGEG